MWRGLHFPAIFVCDNGRRWVSLGWQAVKGILVPVRLGCPQAVKMLVCESTQHLSLISDSTYNLTSDFVSSNRTEIRIGSLRGKNSMDRYKQISRLQDWMKTPKEKPATPLNRQIPVSPNIPGEKFTSSSICSKKQTGLCPNSNSGKKPVNAKGFLGKPSRVLS